MTLSRIQELQNIENIHTTTQLLLKTRVYNCQGPLTTFCHGDDFEVPLLSDLLAILLNSKKNLVQ